MKYEVPTEDTEIAGAHKTANFFFQFVLIQATLKANIGLIRRVSLP